MRGKVFAAQVKEHLRGREPLGADGVAETAEAALEGDRAGAISPPAARAAICFGVPCFFRNSQSATQRRHSVQRELISAMADPLYCQLSYLMV